MLCWFLPYNNMSHPLGYTCSSLQNLPPSAPRHISPLQVITGLQAELPVSQSSFPPAIDVTHDRVYMSVLFLNLSHVLLHLLLYTSPFSTSASPFLKGQQAHTSLAARVQIHFLNVQGVALPRCQSDSLWERELEEGGQKDTLQPLLLHLVSEL